MSTLDDFLKNPSGYTGLYLSSNQIGDVGATSLGEGLKHCSNLQTLYLNSNKIGDVGASSLGEGLKHCTNLQRLYLHYNQIGDEGATSLGEGLKHCTNLQTLSLDSNKIGDVGASSLGEGLKHCANLKTLDLQSNKIGDVGASSLGEGLKHCTNLQTLDLDSNKIGDVGIEKLVEGLKHCANLKTLDLRNNKIGDKGAKALLEALKVNFSITSINLSDNNISDDLRSQIDAEIERNKEDPFNKMLSALSSGADVKAIDLSGEDIGDDEAKKLVESLKHCLTLERLELGDNDISDDLKEEINFLLARNKEIQLATSSYLAGKHDEAIKHLDRCTELSNESVDHDALHKLKAMSLAALGRYDQAKEYYDKLIESKVKEISDGVSGILGDVSNATEVDNESIKSLYDLIVEGHHRINDWSDNAILVLGNTGAGKSTVTCGLSGVPLKVVMDEKTGKLQLESTKDLRDIIIGHRGSATKIPASCDSDVKGLKIWDCPGFNDTSPVQEIANAFHIRRILENTGKVKLVLVIEESDIVNGRGNNFMTTIEQFMECFSDPKKLNGSVSLIITKVAPHKTVDHIRNNISAVLEDHEYADAKIKEFVGSILDTYVGVFHAPKGLGEAPTLNVLGDIKGKSKYMESMPDAVKIELSDKGKDYAGSVFNAACRNFKSILSLITKSVTNGDLNPLTSNYDELIRQWVPNSMSHGAITGDRSSERFAKIKLLSSIQSVLEKDLGSSASFEDSFKAIEKVIKVLREFSGTEVSDKIDSYGYVLNQQYEYMRFFAEVCKRSEDLKGVGDKIASILSQCCDVVSHNLLVEIEGIGLEAAKSSGYYVEAIAYLEQYPESMRCKKLKADGYKHLGSIAESATKNDIAIYYYTSSLKYDKEQPDLYKKLGKLFFDKKAYKQAIECYKVLNDSYHALKCFKELLSTDPENPELLKQKGDYLASIGSFEKASRCYNHALGCSDDVDFRVTLDKKIAETLGSNFREETINKFYARSGSKHYCNHESADEKFIECLFAGVNVYHLASSSDIPDGVLRALVEIQLKYETIKLTHISLLIHARPNLYDSSQIEGLAHDKRLKCSNTETIANLISKDSMSSISDHAVGMMALYLVSRNQVNFNQLISFLEQRTSLPVSDVKDLISLYLSKNETGADDLIKLMSLRDGNVFTLDETKSLGDKISCNITLSDLIEKKNAGGVSEKVFEMLSFCMVMRKEWGAKELFKISEDKVLGEGNIIMLGSELIKQGRLDINGISKLSTDAGYLSEQLISDDRIGVDDIITILEAVPDLQESKVFVELIYRLMFHVNSSYTEDDLLYCLYKSVVQVNNPSALVNVFCDVLPNVVGKAYKFADGSMSIGGISKLKLIVLQDSSFVSGISKCSHESIDKLLSCYSGSGCQDVMETILSLKFLSYIKGSDKYSGEIDTICKSLMPQHMEILENFITDGAIGNDLYNKICDALKDHPNQIAENHLNQYVEKDHPFDTNDLSLSDNIFDNDNAE